MIKKKHYYIYGITMYIGGVLLGMLMGVMIGLRL